MLDELPKQPLTGAAPVVFRPEADENDFTIEQEAVETQADPARWRVHGVRIERVASMTNWDYYESGLRFQRILDAMGISRALEEAGAQDGDVVVVGKTELVWGEQDD